MNRYRYPGKNPVPAYCCQEKVSKPFTIIKPCPPPPQQHDEPCRGNIYDRAVIRITPDDILSTVGVKFLLEIFSAPVYPQVHNTLLYPINLDYFCDYDFKEGEIVAVQAEDMSSVVCAEKLGVNAIPVKIFSISRTNKMAKRQNVVGTVSQETDSNGVQYFMLTETFNPNVNNDPYFTLIRNRLDFDTFAIRYEIYNIVGVANPKQTLMNLAASKTTVLVDTVDYGRETKERVGMPIVITNLSIVQTP
jgi:hypothetical protein